MDRNTVKYLAEFLEKLDGGYGENVDIAQFCSDADAEKLDITDDLSWLDDFETIINKPLQRVLAKPHLHVKYVKETVKIQTASRLDAEGFAMTLRTPKLWENSENGPRPKSVYMTLFEDEYAIYENRFIRMLIDEMVRYLSDTLKELAGSLGNLRAYLGSRLTAAAALHITGEEEEGEVKSSDEKRILVEGDDPVIETYNRVEKLLKKVKNFKNSFLYKVCYGKTISGTIQPTNILTKDDSYRKCFLFYKRLSVMRGSGKDIEGALFDNGVLKLLYAIYSNGYRIVGKPAFHRPFHGEHSCDAVRFRKGKFTIEVKTHGKKEVILTTTMSPGVGKKLEDLDEEQRKRYTIKTIVKIGDYALEESKGVASKYRKKRLAEGYDDAYVVVYSKTPTDGDGVLNFANKGDLASRAAEDLIRSLTIQLVGSHSIFGKRCPVCGTKCYAMENESVLYCHACTSTWSLVMDNRTEKVWLKRIRN